MAQPWCVVADLDAQPHPQGKLSGFVDWMELIIFLAVELTGRVLESFKVVVVVSTETALCSIDLDV